MAEFKHQTARFYQELIEAYQTGDAEKILEAMADLGAYLEVEL